MQEQTEPVTQPQEQSAGKPSGEQSPQPTTEGGGMQPNLAAALSYVLGFITGIYFWVTEKENKFVRFHAMQSLLSSVAVIIINRILVYTPSLISGLFSLAVFIVWLMLIYKAYNNETWELPVIGGIAKQQIGD